MTELELYHHGVPGMKWGVRNSTGSSSGSNSSPRKSKKSSTTRKVSPSKNKHTIKTDTGVIVSASKRKLRKGIKVVAKNENVNAKVLIANTANVTAGALRVAACFVPGLDVLATGAAAATLVGTTASLKSVKG